MAKITAKNHQFLGVNNAVDALDAIKETRLHEVLNCVWLKTRQSINPAR